MRVLLLSNRAFPNLLRRRTSMRSTLGAVALAINAGVVMPMR